MTLRAWPLNTARLILFMVTPNGLPLTKKLRKKISGASNAPHFFTILSCQFLFKNLLAIKLGKLTPTVMAKMICKASSP